MSINIGQKPLLCLSLALLLCAPSLGYSEWYDQLKKKNGKYSNIADENAPQPQRPKAFQYDPKEQKLRAKYLDRIIGKIKTKGNVAEEAVAYAEDLIGMIFESSPTEVLKILAEHCPKIIIYANDRYLISTWGVDIEDTAQAGVEHQTPGRIYDIVSEKKITAINRKNVGVPYEERKVQTPCGSHGSTIKRGGSSTHIFTPERDLLSTHAEPEHCSTKIRGSTFIHEIMHAVHAKVLNIRHCGSYRWKSHKRKYEEEHCGLFKKVKDSYLDLNPKPKRGVPKTKPGVPSNYAGRNHKEYFAVSGTIFFGRPSRDTKKDLRWLRGRPLYIYDIFVDLFGE